MSVFRTPKEAEEASKAHKCTKSINAKVDRADDPRTMMTGWYCMGCGDHWDAPLYNKDGKLGLTEIYDRSFKRQENCTDNGVSFSVEAIVQEKLLDHFGKLPHFVRVKHNPQLGEMVTQYITVKEIDPKSLRFVSFDFSFIWTDSIKSLEKQAHDFVEGMKLLRHIRDNDRLVVRLNVSNDVD